MLTIAEKTKLEEIQTLAAEIAGESESLGAKLATLKAISDESLSTVSSYTEEELTEAVQSTNWCNQVAISLGFQDAPALINYVADILPHIEQLVGGKMTEMSAVDFGNLLQSKKMKVCATEKALEDAKKLLEEAV